MDDFDTDGVDIDVTGNNYNILGTAVTHLRVSRLLLMSCSTTKPTYWPVRPGKTQISLSIRPVGSESSLCAQWVAKDQMRLHADNEDSDQTGRMTRLISVFAGRKANMLVLSWGGSYVALSPGALPNVVTSHLVFIILSQSQAISQFWLHLHYAKVTSTPILNCSNSKMSKRFSNDFFFVWKHCSKFHFKLAKWISKFYSKWE